jgi:hypothetical protein
MSKNKNPSTNSAFMKVYNALIPYRYRMFDHHAFVFSEHSDFDCLSVSKLSIFSICVAFLATYLCLKEYESNMVEKNLLDSGLDFLCVLFLCQATKTKLMERSCQIIQNLTHAPPDRDEEEGEEDW